MLIHLKWSQRGAIMLTHEINNFTMQEAIDYYGRLQDVFKVSLSMRVVFLLRVIYHGFSVYCSRWCSL